MDLYAAAAVVASASAPGEVVDLVSSDLEESGLEEVLSVEELASGLANPSWDLLAYASGRALARNSPREVYLAWKLCTPGRCPS